MIVIELYLARTDLFRRPDESVADHTKRVGAIMDKQFETFKTTDENGLPLNPDDVGKGFQEVKHDWPDWLVGLIKSLHRRWYHPILYFLRLKKKIAWEAYDPDNRVWKVFFKDRRDASRAFGWRATGQPDEPGEFQKRFQKIMASEPEKAKWAESNRLQIAGLTDVSSDVIESDGDLLDHHRAVGV